jgi:hypothetical protein
MVMISLYRDFSFAEEQTDFEKMHPEMHVKKVLDGAKFFATNAKMAVISFLKKDLRKFDGIFHDKRCEVRSAFLIDVCASSTLKGELVQLKERAEQIERKINSASSQLSQFTLYGQAGLEILEGAEFSCTVSQQVSLLLRAHLLTIGKQFDIKADGSSIATVQPNVLRERLKTKLSDEAIKKIIIASQREGTIESVAYIQQESKRLFGSSLMLEDRYVRQMKVMKPGQRDEPYTVFVSCALYALKTAIASAIDQNCCFLVREYRGVKDTNPEKAIGVYFGVQEGHVVPLEKAPHADIPLFVIECLFASGTSRESLIATIDELGFMTVCLANIAQAPQYGYDDDISLLEPDAQEEINRYRQLGQTLTAFKIVHTSASTSTFEKVR